MKFIKAFRPFIELAIVILCWQLVDSFVEDFNVYWMLGIFIFVMGVSSFGFPRKD